MLTKSRLLITTEVDTMLDMSDMNTKQPSVHPGEILWEDFMLPLGLTQAGLARAIRVYPRRVYEIVHGQRRITADIALRLARFLGTSAELWMNLQTHYDLEVARDQREVVILAEIEPFSGTPPAQPPR